MQAGSLQAFMPPMSSVSRSAESVAFHSLRPTLAGRTGATINIRPLDEDGFSEAEAQVGTTLSIESDAAERADRLGVRQKDAAQRGAGPRFAIGLFKATQYAAERAPATIFDRQVIA